MESKSIRLFFGVVVCECIALGATAQSIVTTPDFRPPGVTNMVGFDFRVGVVQSTGLVYVGTTSAYGDKVGVIDPTTDSLFAVIQLPTSGPVNFARVNQTTGLVYFRQPNSNLVVIDGRRSSPTFNQALPSLTFPGEIQSFALDERRSLLYVTSIDFSVVPSESRLSIVDVNPSSPFFHAIVNRVQLPVGVLARGVAVNSVTNKIYLAVVGGGGGVHVVDGANLARTLVAGTAPSFGVIVNEAANLIYATATTNRLNAVDGNIDAVVAVISLPGLIQGALFDERLAINTMTGRVYVRSNDVSVAGKVIVVDGDRFSPTFNTVLASIDVGRAPGSVGLVVDEAFNRILTTAFFDHRTSIIDGTTNTVVAQIASTQIPSHIALDPLAHRAYVANQLNFVQRIDVPSGTLTETTVTGAELPLGVVNPTNHRLYFPVTTNTSGMRLVDKSGNLGTVTGFPTSAGRYLFTAINRLTNRIYVVNAQTNLVSIVDGASNSVIANVVAGNQPFGLGVNETTNKIYVVNSGNGVEFPGSISVIDGATNTAVAANTSAFPNTAKFFRDMAVNETTNKIYFQVSAGAPTTIGVLDGFTNLATPLPESLGPVSDIAVNKNLNRVYIASRSAGLLHVLASTTDAEIATLTTGSPVALAVNQTNGRVYAANQDNNTVSVIDGITNTILATIAVGNGPDALAVNELANRVYVDNQTSRTISFIDGASSAVTATVALTDPQAIHGQLLFVDPVVARLYAIPGDSSALLTIICDADGTLAALEQAIIVATVGDPLGIQRSMLAKLANARKACAAGNLTAANNILQALADEVEAQRGKALTHAEADHIQALIAAVINAGCCLANSHQSNGFLFD